MVGVISPIGDFMANAIEHCWSRAWEDFEGCGHPLAVECKGTEIAALKTWPTPVDIAKFSKTAPTSRNNGHRKSMADRFGNLIQTIHKFAPAFDVFVQQQPIIATIVWGSCRFLVQAVVSSIRLSERVNAALHRIVPNLVGICREASLFTAQQSLHDSVTTYFTQIILFLALTRRHFGRSRAVRWLRAPFTPDFDEALESIQSSAQHTAEELRLTALKSIAPLRSQTILLSSAEISIAQTDEIQEQHRFRTGMISRRISPSPAYSIILESSSHLRRIEDAAKSLLHIQEQSVSVKETITKERIICWLGQAVYDPGFIRDAEPGTCCGVYQKSAWKTWVIREYPHALLLTGVQGIGKTVHCKAIIARAAREKQIISLSYFFGSTGGQESTRAQSLAISLLWQLLQYEVVSAHPQFDSVLPKVQPFLNTYQDVHRCHLNGLLQLLDSFLPLAGEVLVVVDALNECAAGPDAALLQKYLFKLGRSPNTKIIISALDKCLLQSDNGEFSHVHLDRSLVEPDIVRFLKRTIRGNNKFIAKGEEIVKTVVARSQGIFLHATLLVNDLETALSVKEQIAKMDQFGNRVSDEYERQFHEHDAKLSDQERNQRDNYFRILLAARTSVNAQRISEAIACSNSTGKIDENAVVFDPEKNITSLCFPLVEVVGNIHVVFIHGSARDFLLKKHLTLIESELFLARKCLAALREERYRNSPIPSRLLRKHLLAGTIYFTDMAWDQGKYSALYDYATLYWQDHVVKLKEPPDDIIHNLAAFLQGIEFVSYSEYLLDLTKQSSLGNQIKVYNDLLEWTHNLPAPIKAAIPLEDYFEKAHITLSAALSEGGRDKILQYLPLVRNGNYLNSGGQSTGDWLKAYKYKRQVVAGFSDVLGENSPVTLRYSASLLQEYFWQKRFDEVLPELLAVARAQRHLGSVGEPDLYTTLCLLGVAYHCLTRLDEAVEVFTEAAEGVAHKIGKSDRQYLLISLYKGHTLEQLLRFDDAMVLYEDVKKTLTPIVGSANGFTLMSQTAIGAVQRKEGRFEEARVNLEDGWLGRKKIFSIDVNVCADAAVQLALLYRDNMQGRKCIEVLDSISGSKVYKEDFERYCQIEHIRALVAFDNGNFEEQKLALLRLLHQASGSERDSNNRELMWVRETLAQVMRYLGQDDLALTLFFELVQVTVHRPNDLSDEPEPPSQLRLAEKAVHLVREARSSDARQLLHENGLQWVREADFYILGEGGPIADTAVMAPIRFPAT